MSATFRRETISLGQRFLIAFAGPAVLSIFVPFLSGSSLPFWLSVSITIGLHVLLFSVRRTVRIENGVAEIGYGLFVPWWWSKVTTQGLGEVGLVSRSVRTGENGRRTVVDLSLDHPRGSSRIWRASITKAADARRLGERTAVALGVPFRDLVGGSGLRPPESLDLTLRERVRRHGYQRQNLHPPADLDLRTEGESVVMHFPHRWVRLHFLYVLVAVAILPMAFPAVRAVQTGDVVQLWLIVAVVLMVGLIVVAALATSGTEELPVRRIHLSPTEVTMVRGLLGIPLRKSVSVAAVEDVNVVQVGAIAGRLAIASDEAILVADADLPHRDFVASYIAQWVAYADPG